jgi:hypothetical protein
MIRQEAWMDMSEMVLTIIILFVSVASLLIRTEEENDFILPITVMGL